ncbi:hypothetical protein BaRGS_00012517 [Batillaria attramentaria]|uniref:Uncharacterized protein n=1 Tax=Batillaria attramentaria TaxID=370345 RepID=A0ABD0LAF4_9CAEN
MNVLAQSIAAEKISGNWCVLVKENLLGTDFQHAANHIKLSKQTLRVDVLILKLRPAKSPYVFFRQGWLCFFIQACGVSVYTNRRFIGKEHNQF